MNIITTQDGSNTIYLPQIDESYHSVFGAIGESKHIFINNGLQCCKLNDISVLEIGFGTGLNTYLTLLASLKNGKVVDYCSLEFYPLSQTTVDSLNFPLYCGKKEYFELIHSCQWQQKVRITDNFYLTKLKIDFTEVRILPVFDVCYFDAFSPDKQPEMWRYDRLELLYKYASNGAILTTYCSKGEVRRSMQNVGFKVERLPGPIGKREMLKAIK